jgi:serine protease Do
MTLKRSLLVNLISVLGILLVAGFACNFLTEEATPTLRPADTQAPNVTRPTLQTMPTEAGIGQITEPAVGKENAELARATVQIFALYESGGEWQVVWSGSGSIIRPDGLTLTNAHVVDDRYGEYTHLGVAITERTDQPPELMYLAEIAAVDYGLDFAVIRIVSDLDGNPAVVDLPYVGLGDSDAMEIGDHLRILGFPGIGGNTITFTEGTVSGFTQERGIDGRAWIKTDATIAGGNSGGMAVDNAGLLIGVPTQASAGGDQVVDCRPVADTNRDGYVDENDTCVPIGGFLNGLRPINLAMPLIEATINQQEYVAGSQPSDIPTGDYDLSNVDFYSLEFADGVTEDDQPTQLWYALPSETTDIYAFWNYDGMVDGLNWSAYWYVNQELDEEVSFIDITWQGGESGSWWVSISNENGLADGLYELILQVGGETMVSDAIYVGGNRSLVDFTISNESSYEVWYVFLSPLEAQNWGQDELGEDEIIEPGGESTVKIANGTYDMLLADSDGNTLYEEWEMDISENMTFTLTD